jgi:polysaccharide biosynthesis protein PslG
LLSVAVGLVLAALLPPVMPTLAQSDDPRFFAQTGFRVDNDAFWRFFQTRGGTKTFGYPVSRQFKLDGFPVQIFQRLVLQLQPDGSVGTLNLLDSGLMPYTHINSSTFPAPDPALIGQTPPTSDPTYAVAIISFVQSNAPDIFDGNQVNFGRTFMATVSPDAAFPGGDGPTSLLPLLDLQLWGAPTSKPTYDPNNHNFIYQRFQRGIMHFDKGCGCTQGLLLADAFKLVLIGQDLPPDLAADAQTSRFYQQYAPGRALSLARPDQMPGSDLTDAFVPQQPLPPTATSPSAWGYGFQIHVWGASQDAKNQTMRVVTRAGFSWIKHQIEWQAVETAPGQYDWSELDSIVATAVRSGLRVLLSVVHAPAFRRGPRSGLMPADPASFQQFMQALAARYAGRVQAYELWNEENLDREAGAGNVSPATYLPLLKAGFRGTRAGDPKAQVLLGAPSPTGVNMPGASMDDLTYLQQLYMLNGGEVKGYFDALAAHPSGFSNPPDCTPATPKCSLSGGWNNHPSFFGLYRVGQYRDTMVGSGDGNKPIWITEFGYCSSSSPPAGYEYCAYVSPQQQAEFLVQAFQLVRDRPYIAGLVQWNLNFASVVTPTDEKWGFGIVRADWTARPAYTALAQLAKR